MDIKNVAKGAFDAIDGLGSESFAKKFMKDAGADVLGQAVSNSNDAKKVAKAASKYRKLDLEQQLNEAKRLNADGKLSDKDFSEFIAKRDRAQRFGNGVSGAATGAIVGSGAGAIIGGISAGVDDDENTSVAGGIFKGALGGAAVGGAGGFTYGAIRNNGKVLSQAGTDIKKVSKAIANWKTGDGA